MDPQAAHVTRKHPSRITADPFMDPQVVHVTRKHPSGWWEGRLPDGTVGWFPSTFVRTLQAEIGVNLQAEIGENLRLPLEPHEEVDIQASSGSASGFVGLASGSPGSPQASSGSAVPVRA